MSEEKQIVIELTEDIGSPALGVCFERAVRYEGSVKTIRVFPAAPIDPKAPPLTPVELYEAVQMWVNRSRSIPEDLVTQLHKDAEIRRLSNALESEKRIREDLSEACGEHEEEIARLNGVITQITHCHGELQRVMFKQRDQIADLEKLSTMQKATIDAQGKELHQKQTALANLRDLVNPQRRSCLTCENTECVILICADQTCWTQAQKKEPELFICPNSGIKPGCDHCDHRVPHQHKGKLCEDHLCGMSCSICKGVGCKCIPYKEPSQTPAPEEGKSPLQHLQDRVLELEQHQGRDRADLMEKIRVLESQAHAAYCCNDDAAKGIGVLTLRADNMEKDAEILKDSFVTPHGIDIANIFTRVSRLETALESLKDKTGRELSQAFAEVSRVLAERKQNADVARDASNAQAHGIIEMQGQIKGLEHRLGMALDRIAEIRLAVFMPTTKSKPKSRLKTDRVKKVK